MLNSKEDVLCGIVYIPPEGSKYVTTDYVLTTLEVFKFLQDFDIVDFCNLYSDVRNPVTLSFANCKNVPNQAYSYINKSLKIMVTRQGRGLL